MDLIEFVADYGSWAWIIGGLVMLAIELVVSGGVFIWLGGAAIVTGLITLVLAIGWPLQWALFGFIAILGIFIWLRYWRPRQHAETDSPFLNQRAARFVGHETVLNEPIANGDGRINLEDSVWRVVGPDLPAGARVRVSGYEGAVLTVEEVQ